MKGPNRTILKRLIGTRAKPTPESALVEFFMTVKSMSIEELISACHNLAGSSAAAASKRPDTSALLAETKKKLRAVGGNAADFLPYLQAEIEKDKNLRVTFNKKTSLSVAISDTEAALGAAARNAVGSAMNSYVADNDVSYKLKSA